MPGTSKSRAPIGSSRFNIIPTGIRATTEAEEKFKEAAEAYAILSDGDKRARYDRFGHAGVSSQAGGGFDPSTFAGFEDIFGGIFGDFFGGGAPRRSGARQRPALRPRDHVRRVGQRHRDLDSDSASRNLRDLPRLRRRGGSSPTTCPQCQGRGQQRFQQGFFTVARTCSRCSGTGRIVAKPCATCKGAGPHVERTQAHGQGSRRDRRRSAAAHQRRRRRRCCTAGLPGDLYVFIEVAPHAFFRREGNNLSCEVPLNFTTLALGGSIEVPTLEGHEPFKVPEGTQSGTSSVCEARECPMSPAAGRGDLFFTVQAVTPKKLNKEQRALLEQLSKALPKEKFEPRPVDAEDDDKNLFEKVKDIFG